MGKKDESDLTGQVFGDWTVLGKGKPHILPSGNKQPTWKCLCSCGAIRDVVTQRLKNGRSTSCGECKKPNLIGEKSGYLTVVGVGERRKRNNGKFVKTWDCICVCGNHRFLTTQEIKTEKRKSCGCKQTDFRKESATIHGDSHTRLHNIWSGMRARCYLPTDYHYKWYGGRGITMCNEWRDDYVAFKEWALSNGYAENLTIDRIDNDGDYCPENCRWVSMKIQANNRTRTKYYEAFGERHTLSEWADIVGVTIEFLRGRIKNGWDIEKALLEKKRESVDGHYVYDDTHIFRNGKSKNGQLCLL